MGFRKRVGADAGVITLFYAGLNLEPIQLSLQLTPERVELCLHVPFSSHNIGLLIVQRDSFIITATVKKSEAFDLLVCYVTRDGSCLLTF